MIDLQFIITYILIFPFVWFLVNSCLRDDWIGTVRSKLRRMLTRK